MADEVKVRRFPEAPRKDIELPPAYWYDDLGDGEPVNWLDDDELDPDPTGLDPHTDNIGDEGE